KADRGRELPLPRTDVLAGDEHDVVGQRGGTAPDQRLRLGGVASAGAVVVALIGVPGEVDVLAAVHRDQQGSAEGGVDAGGVGDLDRLERLAPAAEGGGGVGEPADADAHGAVGVVEHRRLDHAA